MDTLTSWYQNRVLRRLFQLGLFIGLLFLFRKLLIMLVFFVAFERLIGIPSDWIARRTRINRKLAVGGVLLGLFAIVSGAIAFGTGRAIRAFFVFKQSLPDRIAAFKETPLYERIEEHIKGTESLLEQAQHYSKEALQYATAAGHMIAYASVGFVFALVYLFERDELATFWTSINQRSLQGTLMRWLGYVVESMQVTLGFQVIVAACNAVLTYPVLLILGIPHAVGLVFMAFFSGMVPVIGNFVAGAILTLLAYQTKGWTGVGIFLALTFLLHKIESYYLSPRLAARHVRLPAFVMLISLMAWEHLAGFVGLFLSFPFLFIATRIRGEFRVEDSAVAEPVPASGSLSRPPDSVPPPSTDPSSQ